MTQVAYFSILNSDYRCPKACAPKPVLLFYGVAAANIRLASRGHHAISHRERNPVQLRSCSAKGFDAHNKPQSESVAVIQKKGRLWDSLAIPRDNEIHEFEQRNIPTC